MKDTKIRPEITSTEFIRRYSEIKDLLAGKSIEIAELAGAPITRLSNAVRGRVSSPKLLGPLYEAMEKVAEDELERIQKKVSK